MLDILRTLAALWVLMVYALGGLMIVGYVEDRRGTWPAVAVGLALIGVIVLATAPYIH